jgi:hypothetical protein
MSRASEMPGSPQSHAALSVRFRLCRRIARISLTAGLLLMMAGGACTFCGNAPFDGAGIAAFWSGLVLLSSVFPVCLLLCDSCPRCRKPFSDSPLYRGSDTDGLPLFNRIEECPFCGLALDGSSAESRPEA